MDKKLVIVDYYGDKKKPNRDSIKEAFNHIFGAINWFFAPDIFEFKYEVYIREHAWNNTPEKFRRLRQFHIKTYDC